MNIKEYIREELKLSNSDLDPNSVAGRIIARLNTDQRAEALGDALPALVRAMIQNGRYSFNSADREREPELVGASTGPMRAPGRSAKVEHYRSQVWRRELNAIYPDRNGINRHLSTFSSEDLFELANRCQANAEANYKSAERWRSVAKALEDSGKEHLGECMYDAQAWHVGGERNSDQPARPQSETMVMTLADPTLALAADVVDDLERVRIANQNRLRQLTRTGVDKDGGERGFGLDESHPDVARLAALVKMLEDAEHQAVLNLGKTLKRNPLYPWIRDQKGVGDKTAARLLAVVGDPYMNAQTGEPRNVAKLWAYCGHGGPGRIRFKGMTQEQAFALGNPTAKKRVYLISEGMLKAGIRSMPDAPTEFSPETREAKTHWGEVYLDRRAATADRAHAAECKRCGPSGKPAQPGSPWSGAHKQADALRVVGKEFLKELWIEARRLHGEP